MTSDLLGSCSKLNSATHQFIAHMNITNFHFLSQNFKYSKIFTITLYEKLVDTASRPNCTTVQWSSQNPGGGDKSKCLHQTMEWQVVYSLILGLQQQLLASCQPGGSVMKTEQWQWFALSCACQYTTAYNEVCLQPGKQFGKWNILLQKQTVLLLPEVMKYDCNVYKRKCDPFTWCVLCASLPSALNQCTAVNNGASAGQQTKITENVW